MIRKKARIAVVGGGIAGSTAALYLGAQGLDVTLFEKSGSLVSGPPICHLHAGGNLYREISDAQCLTLLKESVDLVRFYPDAVDYRPTVIAVPIEDAGTPEALLPRLKLLRDTYAAMVQVDPRNKVLGPTAEYFRLYSRDEVEALRQRTPVAHPVHPDEWMIPVARHIDLEKVQFPLVLVQEYGLNIFRLGSGAALRLEAMPNSRVLLDHTVTQVARHGDTWEVRFRHGKASCSETFDFLINAAGFRTGELDDMLGCRRERFVEFKAAYVTRWEACDEAWPEVIFYGERGTPRGMGQFTPYPGGYFQLHGMTNAITLFEGGLAQSTPKSAQPMLHPQFMKKIDRNWEFSEVKERSRRAIEHLAQYIPAFKKAIVASKPLYGAQQIPGRDATLRAADVSFEGERYARCEIVKASSVLSMADTITKQLIKLGYLDEGAYGRRDFPQMEAIEERKIGDFAAKLGELRGYPEELTRRSRPECTA